MIKAEIADRVTSYGGTSPGQMTRPAENSAALPDCKHAKTDVVVPVERAAAVVAVAIR